MTTNTQNVPEPSLRKLDDSSIKLIAAGEKISDIETVVRELVENSIDADAKNIEVRLSKFGVECIEVHDDGTGIDEVNFTNLGIRYHTSKIKDYSKLQNSLETFGFRGEALSCLFSLSNVTITTKSKSSPTGTKLIFSKNGTLCRSDPVARGNGTTISVKNLFYTLPVRRRELEQTAKKQYDKVVKLIYEQVLARPYIKFTLCKKEKLDKKNDFTHGGTTLESCIITIFGVKILDSLMPIKQAGIQNLKLEEMKKETEKTSDNSKSVELSQQVSEVENLDKEVDKVSAILVRSVDDLLPTKEDFETTVAPDREEFFKQRRKSKLRREKVIFTIYGYISKPGMGRHTNDCQYIFVNKKPCDIQRVSKVVNEVYRNYTPTQSFPFFCLFIQVQSWAADFNVPRKRAVILQDENKLCDLIKESLDQMYSPTIQSNQKSCPVAQIPLMTPKKDIDSQMIRQGGKRELENSHLSEGGKVFKKQSLEGDSSDDIVIIDMISTNTARKFTPSQSEILVENRNNSDSNTITNGHNQNSSLFSTSKPQSSRYFDLANKTTKKKTRSPPKRPGRPTTPIAPYQFGVDAPSSTNVSKEPSHSGSSSFTTALDYLNSNGNSTDGHTRSTSESQKSPKSGDRSPKSNIESPKTNVETPSHATTSKAYEDGLQLCVFDCKFEQEEFVIDGRLQVNIAYPEELDKAIERERAQRRTPINDKEFNFSIHPKFNVVAEQELKCNLNKRSFEDMQVLGQFNRGFILARLDKHVFIIDQHATDERANYEEQLNKSPLVEQKMVHPKPLYLNSIQESAIINNLEELKKKGFQFVVNEEKPAGYRVLLSATSICKGQGMDEHLTREDLEELIDVLLDSPNSFSSYALKKVRNVAASRACRKSVMIGDQLSWSQMNDIVFKMSNLENPWICAHNRPTIRHLMEVDWMHRD